MCVIVNFRLLASINCHTVEDNAYLFNILSQEDQIYFTSIFAKSSAWTGLRRVSNTDNWYWDQPRSGNLTFVLGSSYSNWALGEPTPKESGKDCVVQMLNGTEMKWFTTYCNATYFYQCQKHRYGQTIMPKDPDMNRIPAGIWTVNVKSTNSCLFEVRIESEIQVYWGFTNDIHSDTANTWGELQTDQNHIIAHTVGLGPLNLNGLMDQVDGHLDYVMVYSPDRSLWYSGTFQERSFCSYPTISQSFSCPGYPKQTQKINFYMKLSGIDQYGNLFERFVPTYCIATAHCVNGFLKPDGSCVCQPYWEGNTCSTRKCLNGGTPAAGGTCNCPDDFGGPNCQYPNCQDPNPISFNDTGITLAILLETSFGTGQTIEFLQSSLTQIIAQVTQDNVTSSKWISNYILYPFDSDSNIDYWYNKTVTSDLTVLATELNNINPYTCPGNTTMGWLCESGANCPRPIIRVLNNTLNDPSFKNPNSVVLIITQSAVSDYAFLGEVQDNAQAKRATVSVILVDTPYPCASALNNTSPESLGLYRIPQVTGGEFFNSYANNLKDLLPYYLPTLYRTSLLGGYSPGQCGDDTFYFPIDSSAQAFALTYTSPGANQMQLTLYDAMNNVVPWPESVDLFTSTYFAFYDFANMNNSIGTWKLVVQAPSDLCIVSIRIRSSIEVYVGFTDPNSDAYGGLLDDGPHYLLSADNPNGLVLHANNLGAGTLNYVQVVGMTNGRIYYYSELTKRIGCNYEYVAPSSFRCEYGNYLVSTMGIDAKGQNFIRNLIVQCVTKRTPPAPRPPRCDTTQVTYDIALVIDTSKKGLIYGDTAWQDFMNSVIFALSSFYGTSGFSINGTRLAAISVSIEPQLLFNFADSEGKTAQQLLGSIAPDNYTGQYLSAAFSIAKNLSMDPSSGYRNKAQYPNVRHLVLYATLNGAQTHDGDAGNEAHLLVRSGAFGVSVVAYADLQNDDAYVYNLGKIASGDCLYYAKDTPISTYIPYYIEDLTCRRYAKCGDN